MKFNDVGSDVSAVIVLDNLKRFGEILKARIDATFRYDVLLQDMITNDSVSVIRSEQNYRYCIRTKNAKEVARQMQSRGIEARNDVVYDYRHTIDWPEGLENTERAFETILSLPFHENITLKEQEKTVKSLQGVLNGN